VDLNWILGFIEGEGCFSIHFGTRYRLVYPKAILQIGNYDKAPLEDTKKCLSEHQIKANIYRVREKRPHHSNLWLLNVIEGKSISRLIELLEGMEWHSCKFDTFKLWKDSILLVRTRPCGKETLIRIVEIASKMNSMTNRANRNRVWTKEFVESHCFEDQFGRVKLNV